MSQDPLIRRLYLGSLWGKDKVDMGEAEPELA